jgi:broad specificity phosphatase PhoE
MTSRELLPLHLYLVRHGETEWTLSNRHTGCTDIPLTARGEEEARNLGPRLRGVVFSHVLTSPCKRAQRTCELVVGLDKAVQVEPDLAEWDYGDYEGLRSVDIRKGRADWDLFRDGCPHGEMPAQVADRADRLITRLRNLNGNVALFSHGQFGGVLAARWIGLPAVNAQHFPLHTASLSIFGYALHHPKVPVVALWNAPLNDRCEEMACPRHCDTKATKPRAIERWENEGGQIPRPAGNARKST